MKNDFIAKFGKMGTHFPETTSHHVYPNRQLEPHQVKSILDTIDQNAVPRSLWSNRSVGATHEGLHHLLDKVSIHDIGNVLGVHDNFTLDHVNKAFKSYPRLVNRMPYETNQKIFDLHHQNGDIPKHIKGTDSLMTDELSNDDLNHMIGKSSYIDHYLALNDNLRPEHIKKLVDVSPHRAWDMQYNAGNDDSSYQHVVDHIIKNKKKINVGNQWQLRPDQVDHIMKNDMLEFDQIHTTKQKLEPRHIDALMNGGLSPMRLVHHPDLQPHHIDRIIDVSTKVNGILDRKDLKPHHIDKLIDMEEPNLDKIMLEHPNVSEQQKTIIRNRNAK